MTQTERVERALDKAGPRGITQVDFLLPDVVDGGKPITRVGARIHDLKRKRGLAIVKHGTRDECDVYMLAKFQSFPDSAVVVAASSAASPVTPTSPPAVVTATPEPVELFGGEEKASSRCAIYDDWDQAA